MRIEIDENRCSGHARCCAIGGSVYELDDVGYALLRGRGEITVDEENVAAALSGAKACPEMAIRIIP